jgi:hypothetical protein
MQRPSTALLSGPALAAFCLCLLAGQAPAQEEEASQAGAFQLVLRVTDGGTRVERVERPLRVARPERALETRWRPADNGGTAPVQVEVVKGTVPASPGFAILGVRLAEPRSVPPDLQLLLSGDRRAVEVSADKADGEVLGTKADGGPAAKAPLLLIEEKRSEVRFATETLTHEWQGFGAWAQGKLKLPPRPGGLVEPRRRFDLEIRQADAAGQWHLVLSAADVQLPWSVAFPADKNSRGLALTQDGDYLHVSWGYVFK